MFTGSNFKRKSQLSGILIEPLNPRDGVKGYMKYIQMETGVMMV